MIKYIFLVFMVSSVVGCDLQDDGSDELENKTEYSILQYYEHEFRESDNNKKYLVFEKSLGTEFTVIGFPIENKTKGYVFIIANDESTSAKFLPQGKFIISQDTYNLIKSETFISVAVDSFIKKNIR